MSMRIMKALLSACLLAAWMAPAQAQSVSCTGVAQWNASTIYNPGDKLVYQGKLYQAQTAIWNAPPTHCPSCGWYLDLGTCSTGGKPVADRRTDFPGQQRDLQCGRHHHRLSQCRR